MASCAWGEEKNRFHPFEAFVIFIRSRQAGNKRSMRRVPIPHLAHEAHLGLGFENVRNVFEVFTNNVIQRSSLTDIRFALIWIGFADVAQRSYIDGVEES